MTGEALLPAHWSQGFVSLSHPHTVTITFMSFSQSHHHFISLPFILSTSLSHHFLPILTTLPVISSSPSFLFFTITPLPSYFSLFLPSLLLLFPGRFVCKLVDHLKEPLLREAAADCIHEVITKGMEPLAKTQLIESFVTVLDRAGVLKPVDVSVLVCLCVCVVRCSVMKDSFDSSVVIFLYGS